MGKREDYHLPIIQGHIAAQLGRPIARVHERSDDGPTHDLETSDGQAPSVAIEVKELVPPEFLAINAQVNGDSGLDSKILTKRWGVVVTEEALSARLAPMPRFPDDLPPDENDSLSYGFATVPKAEREEQWRKRHTLAERPHLRIRNMAKDMEPDLATLERFGINGTRAPNLGAIPGSHRAVSEALWRIKSRTHDSICMARDVFAGEQAGIDLNFGYGAVRTGRADVVAERVQMWLDSEQSANLVSSIRTAGADQGHGALWLSTEEEAQSASEQGLDFCPRLSIALPDGVDALWIFVGPLALRYDGSWTVTEIKVESADLATGSKP